MKSQLIFIHTIMKSNLFLAVLFICNFICLSINGADLYWIGNSGNYNDPTKWSMNSGGTSCNCNPLITDNVFFDQNSFTTSGQIVTINTIAYCKNMVFGH